MLGKSNADFLKRLDVTRRRRYSNQYTFSKVVTEKADHVVFKDKPGRFIPPVENPDIVFYSNAGALNRKQMRAAMASRKLEEFF